MSPYLMYPAIRDRERAKILLFSHVEIVFGRWIARSWDKREEIGQNLGKYVVVLGEVFCVEEISRGVLVLFLWI